MGSKSIIYNKKQVVLTAAPQKIGGRIGLPLRALGEALNKQITYKEGLIFISEKSLALEGIEADQMLGEIKERLQDTRKVLEYPEFPEAVKSVQGQTYYMAYENNSNTQIVTQKLYSQRVGEAAVLVKAIKDFIHLEQPFVENTFYYVQRYQDKISLYAARQTWL